jgi:hypothetical protein
MIYMTLNEIRAFKPCESGWKTLLKSLNKTEADDEPIAFDRIIESNGLRDAIWCMRVKWFEHKPVWMSFVNGCAESAAAANAAFAVAYAYAVAANAADAAVAAVAAATADAYDTAATYTAERKRQTEHLLKLVREV